MERPAGIVLVAVFYALRSPFIFLFWFVMGWALGSGTGGASVNSFPIADLVLIPMLAVPITLVKIPYGLWKGKEWARMGTVIFAGFNLVGMSLVLPYFFPNDPNNLYKGLFLLDMLAQPAIIYYMFTRTARDYLRD